MVFSAVTNTLDYLATPLIDNSNKSASLGRGQTCWKYTQIVISLIFIAFGCVAVWQGASSLAAQSSDGSQARHNNKWPIGLVVSGTLTIVFSLLAILAIKLESFKLLMSYLILTTIASIIMLVIAVLVLTQSMPDIASRYSTFTTERITQIQNNLQCCGLNSITDQYAVQPCPAAATEGCATAITAHISHVITTAGAVGISLSVVMLCTLSATAILAVALKRKHIYVRTSDTDFEMGSETTYDYNKNAFGKEQFTVEKDEHIHTIDTP